MISVSVDVLSWIMFGVVLGIVLCALSDAITGRGQK